MEGRDFLEFYYYSYLFLRKQRITCVCSLELFDKKQEKKNHEERKTFARAMSLIRPEDRTLRANGRSVVREEKGTASTERNTPHPQ